MADGPAIVHGGNRGIKMLSHLFGIRTDETIESRWYDVNKAIFLQRRINPFNVVVITIYVYIVLCSLLLNPLASSFFSHVPVILRQAPFGMALGHVNRLVDYANENEASKSIGLIIKEFDEVLKTHHNLINLLLYALPVNVFFTLCLGFRFVRNSGNGFMSLCHLVLCIANAVILFFVLQIAFTKLNSGTPHKLSLIVVETISLLEEKEAKIQWNDTLRYRLQQQYQCCGVDRPMDYWLPKKELTADLWEFFGEDSKYSNAEFAGFSRHEWFTECFHRSNFSHNENTTLCRFPEWCCNDEMEDCRMEGTLMGLNPDDDDQTLNVSLFNFYTDIWSHRKYKEWPKLKNGGCGNIFDHHLTHLVLAYVVLSTAAGLHLTLAVICIIRKIVTMRAIQTRLRYRQLNKERDAKRNAITNNADGSKTIPPVEIPKKLKNQQKPKTTENKGNK